MTTCSFLCRVAWRKGMQSCYFFGMLSWMWQYHNLLGVENQLHEKYGRVSRSERYFYQIINREKFQPEISKWLIISSSSCMTGTVSTKVLVSIYTDESHNVQLPTYTRCFAATRSPGKATARHMGALHDTGQNLSKFAIFRLFCGWQRREVASTDNITKSIISM